MNALANVVQEPQAHRMSALIPTSIREALDLAGIMAQASLVPTHLQGKAGDCLLVVMQAQRWGMDALSVAQCTSVVRGKLCYEGKLVAAVLYAMGAIEGRLKYKYSGDGDNRKIVVTGRVRGENEDVSIEGTVGKWKTDNAAWKNQPDDMLAYRGTRQWARRYAPESLLGVNTPDEIEEIDITPGASAAQKPAGVSMPKERKPAIEGEAHTVEKTDTADTPEDTTTETNVVPGIFLEANPKSMLLKKGMNAGFNEEELIEKYTRIDITNLNAVLAELRIIAEKRDNG